MARWLCPLAALVALAGVIALTLETRRLAELVGRGDIEVRAATAARDAAARERDELRAALAAAGQERDTATAAQKRLEGEVFAAQKRLEDIQAVIRERTAQFEQAAANASRAAADQLRPMPEGVRACLVALHDYLRLDGFTQQRFLSAQRLDADGLHGVEMLDTAGDGLSAAFVQAGRMTASLDRSAGRLELRFFDGVRTEHGETTPLPTDGLAIVYAPVDGRVVEARLPMLVRAAGEYPPADDGDAAAHAHAVDGAVQRQWLRRFERLLAAAGTDERLDVRRFRGLADGCFLGAEIHGTDSKHMLRMYANCDRLAVEVDAASGVVSLWLRGGVLHREGVESTISADQGLRMMLPDVTPRMATEAMLGMVVAK